MAHVPSRLATLAAAALAALAALAAAPAEAVPITTTYTFAASNFIPPAGPVSGSVTVTLDPAGPALQMGTVNAIHLTIAGFTYPTATFAYFPNFDSLLIGGGATIAPLDTSINDFTLGIASATSGTPSPFVFAFSTGTGQAFVATNGSVSAVPEPATLALLGSGLAGLGLTLRRRRRGEEIAPAA